MVIKKKANKPSGPHKMEGIAIPDWAEIKGYFTDIDRQHMLSVSSGNLDLHDCNDVLNNAADIYGKVSSGQMPPGNPWGPDKINGFYSWWKSDPKCPKP